MVVKILVYMYKDYNRGSDDWEEAVSYSLGMVKKMKLSEIWDEIRQ
jgi:hypothetical protein